MIPFLVGLPPAFRRRCAVTGADSHRTAIVRERSFLELTYDL
jgi:hypothetical protein